MLEKIEDFRKWREAVEQNNKEVADMLQNKENENGCAWVARDKDNEFHMFNVKPHKDEKEGIWYIDDYDDLVAQKRGLMPDCIMLEERLLPEIQWIDEEPTEIEIIVKK